ncbi:hypothetical protein DDB_G0271354 [Dictyostelium discoideum AX4]|uniref:Uncharacterized protein n=1 Tax=Dictyostelium discoideum TaxID=44689 RepID=Q55BI7_DICDI|nr:hypothetical protein DDB_G0271354 [Dictyostelium discoideum AX4]EAL71807.1 hypothetical protein DDB_G0271354 [Dictyostelium discoideum AX4]|eukprot:XP_645625.1 hypothetical protein DDB_G0271354 [Dictyostelium discoideum AX4]
MKLIIKLICFITLLLLNKSIVESKYYGVQHLESYYNIIEIGTKNSIFKLDYSHYGDILGNNFKSFEKVVSGNFVDGYFQIDKVFRQLVHPGRQFDYSIDDKFYTIRENTSIIEQLNFELNNKVMTNVDQTYSDEVPNFHSSWLLKKVSDGEAVFTTINNLITASQGIVEADYIWISTPDPVGCPPIKDKCAFPFILTPTYTRDDNRCIKFTGCVRILKNPLCIFDLTSCPAFYKKVSFASSPDACIKIYCDPNF